MVENINESNVVCLLFLACSDAEIQSIDISVKINTIYCVFYEFE